MGLIDAYHGKRVYLDTNFFIYTLENFAPTAGAVARIGQMIQQGDLAAFASELSLAETLVVPMRKSDQRLVDLYCDLISSRDGLTVVPATRAIRVQTAHERSASAFKLPDAVHIAAARI
jgi:predicted nucleic acid-binding protein